jgi:photosystem II stability/assembly factor-like uncharacterized protein
VAIVAVGAPVPGPVVSSSALASPVRPQQSAPESAPTAELTLNSAKGATTTEELDSFSFAVTAAGTGGAGAVLTGDIDVSSPGAGQLLVDAWAGGQYTSAVLVPYPKAAGVSYELMAPSVSAQVARAADGSSFVQVVVTAKAASFLAPPAAPTAWGARPSGTSDNLSGVACASSNDCVAVGEQGTILASSDGGATWQARKSGTDVNLDAVVCPSNLFCLAVGGYGISAGTILASNDGGATWLPRQFGRTAELEAIACASRGTCVAVGQRGTILASTDGGGTWRPRPSGTSNDLYAVACSSDRACLAVGNDGTTLASPDGGGSWRALHPGPWSYVNGAACPSTNLCLVVVGEGGSAVQATSDGGATWQSRLTAAPGDDTLQGINCPSGQACLVVGSHGTLLASVDGGTTWQPVGSGTRAYLSAVTCAPSGACVAVGASGTIVTGGEPKAP